MRRFVTIVPVLLVSFLSAARSEAQAVASNFDELRFRLEAGDTVYISDSAGQEQKARVLEVSSSLLAVSIGGSRGDLAESGVSAPPRAEEHLIVQDESSRAERTPNPRYVNVRKSPVPVARLGPI